MLINSYLFEDTKVESGQVYYYRLKQLDYNGSAFYSNVIAVKASSAGLSLSIGPNPYPGKTNIVYELQDKSNVKLEVFNAEGKRMLLLDNGIQEKGSHTYIFTSPFSSGLYLLRLTTGEQVISMKMIQE